VENLYPAANLDSPSKINATLEKLDPDYFVSLVDVGHANLQRYAPESFIRKILPGRLQGLHVHDNHGEKDEHIVPYLGDIRWEYVLEALAEINYTGDLTLELPGFIPKYSPNMLPEALAFAAGVGRKMVEQFLAMKG
jgi:sugar phosphate isomerase/epimerase